MKLLKENLESELFKVLKTAKEKIIIISPFMNLSSTEKLVAIIKNNSIDCTVITRFERKSFIENAHSLDALRLLLSKGVEVLALQNLHSKIYLVDYQHCFAGSANFTSKGLNINHEILMHFDNQEVKQFNTYVSEILATIKQSGDWQITLEQIEAEEQIVSSYKDQLKEDKRLNNSWGADITSPSPDESSLVLSVPAGDTIHLIEKYLIHSHPISRGYNYKPTKYLTFRKAKGGVMDTIYIINKTFSLEMDNWENLIEEIGIDTSEKENLINYILGRYRDFVFDKAPQYKYKFYLLSVLCELPNAPHPPNNNSGGWIYTLNDLKESKDIVYTINKIRT